MILLVGSQESTRRPFLSPPLCGSPGIGLSAVSLVGYLGQVSRPLCVRASFACNIRLWKRLSHVEPMQARGPQPRSAPPPPSPLLLRYVSPLLLENPLRIHVQRSPRLRSRLVWTQAAAGPRPGALIYGLTSGSCPNIASLLTRAETRCCVDLILPWTPVALPSEA